MSFSYSRLIPLSIITYLGGSYFTYRYSAMEKANAYLRDIPNKREYLYTIHERIAPTYDSFVEKRERTNKMHSYRKTLLSYAEGRVLETGCGTSRNAPYYPSACKVTAVDWSVAMIEEALAKPNQEED